MTALAEEARRLAPGEVEPKPVDLGAAAAGAWEAVDSSDATLEIEGGTITADPDLLGLPPENLLRNSVEHSSPSNRASPDDSVEHGSTDAEGDESGGRTGPG